MRILQINTTVNTAAPGRIAEDIGKVLIANGHNSYIAYGRGNRPSQSQLIKIGSMKDVYLHGAKTILLDRHGFGSSQATKELIIKIKEIQPDAIGLHNLHGYYINIELLFKYLSDTKIPVLWTLHDCWPFTGHCSYFDAVFCFKWKTECHQCPNIKGYPASWGLDQSRRNFREKRKIFYRYCDKV